jgi:hypothetical protein
MFAAIVVLWLGSEPELAERRADIATWAQARQLRAEPLRPTGPSYDPALSDEIEKLLEESRTQSTSPRTPDALQRAETLLLEHPELPQAAWLLAERYAIEAHALATDDGVTSTRRAELVSRALGLEGVRALAVGAPAAASDAASPARVPAPHGARPRDRVFIDGLALDSAAEPAQVAAGRHHSRLSRGTLLVWSGWITLEPGPSEPLPDPTLPCSSLDLADVDAGATGPEPAPGVRCEHWAVARPSLLGGVELAECSGSRCGAWQRGAAQREALAGTLDGAPSERGGWPGWATWSLIGAGAVAATGIVLWQAGAFERDAPGTEFVFPGPCAAAYHF